MSESQSDYLYDLFKRVLDSIIEEKKLNPKNLKKITSFKGRINLGLHTEQDTFVWLNLIANNGTFVVEKGKLDDNYDLILKAAPEDLMFFCNGEHGVLHMILKKNRFKERNLLFEKGTTGRNLIKLLKLSKIIVLDKNIPPQT